MRLANRCVASGSPASRSRPDSRMQWADRRREHFTLGTQSRRTPSSSRPCQHVDHLSQHHQRRLVSVVATSTTSLLNRARLLLISQHSSWQAFCRVLQAARTASEQASPPPLLCFLAPAMPGSDYDDDEYDEAGFLAYQQTRPEPAGRGRTSFIPVIDSPGPAAYDQSERPVREQAPRSVFGERMRRELSVCDVLNLASGHLDWHLGVAKRHGALGSAV